MSWSRLCRIAKTHSKSVKNQYFSNQMWTESSFWRLHLIHTLFPRIHVCMHLCTPAIALMGEGFMGGVYTPLYELF